MARAMAGSYPYGVISMYEPGAMPIPPGSELHTSYLVTWGALKNLANEQAGKVRKTRIGFWSLPALAGRPSGAGGASTTALSDQRCPHGTLSHIHESPDAETCSFGNVPECVGGSRAGVACRCCSTPPCSTTCDSSLDATDCPSSGVCTAIPYRSTGFASMLHAGTFAAADPGYGHLPTGFTSFEAMAAKFSSVTIESGGSHVSMICDGEASNESCPDPNSESVCDKITCTGGTGRVPIYYSTQPTLTFDGGTYTASAYSAGTPSISQTSTSWTTDQHKGATVFADYGEAGWSWAHVVSNTAGTLTLDQALGGGVGVGTPFAIDADNLIPTGFPIEAVLMDLRAPLAVRWKANALLTQMYEAKLGNDHPVALILDAQPAALQWQDRWRYKIGVNPCGRYRSWGVFGPWSQIPDGIGCPSARGGAWYSPYDPGDYEEGICLLHSLLESARALAPWSVFSDVKYAVVNLPALRGADTGGHSWCPALLSDSDFLGSPSLVVTPDDYPVFVQ